MSRVGKTWFGALLVIVTLVTATYLTFLSTRRTGLELEAGGREAGSAFRAEDVPEEMRGLTHLFRTINLVQKRYLDSTRINPKEMFVSAMRAIQIHVAKVMVQETDNTLILKLGDLKRELVLSELKNPWTLLQRLKEVFELLKNELDAEKIELPVLEQAAINGMLRTLDPHSVFLNSDQYREMRDKTQGKFAGLGIVISIRDGVLTIIAPMDGTPAKLSGLEAGDQILKIDEASTVNMSLNDAVDLLRGDPGTTVTVHVLRKGWDAPKAFKIVRAIVKVESLDTEMLKGRVGYVRIKDFQGNTSQDIQDQLAVWQRQGLTGLIIDLRGCPGGLLEAAVQVSDLFLKRGVIVTTAGQGPGERDVRRATDSGDEPDYPLVVLVDRGSASASEILAGALKNHGRAVVVGERTFGKGSVQVLFEFQDETGNNATTALKLTTAQYLTPGDISIQSFGVVPHVELHPMRADKEVIDLQVLDGYRESDLDQHLEVQSDKGINTSAVETLSYLWTPPKNETPEGEETDGGLPTSPLDPNLPFEPDYPIELAQDFVLKLSKAEGGYLNFKVLSKRLEQKRAVEEKRLVAALHDLGIDWRDGPGGGTPEMLDTAIELGEGGTLTAGEKTQLTLRVTNRGGGTFRRLAATSDSDFRPLDDRELAFGRVGPGETVSRTLTLNVPRDSFGEVSDVRWTFSAEKSTPPPPIAVRFEVTPLSKPHFAYSYRLDDTEKGNGDGRLQPGETVKVFLNVENTGRGTAFNTYATMKGLTEKGLFMVQGRETLEELKPGGQKSGTFSFEVKPDFTGDEVRFELAISDVDLRVYLVEKLSIPVEKTGVPAAEKVVAGPSFPALRSAPKIALDAFPRATQSESMVLRGTITDETAIRYTYIFVGDDKLFFQSNRDNPNPKELRFSAELPLKNGLNFITVVAEESVNLENRKVIVVRRDRSDGMPYIASRVQDAVPELLGVMPTKSDRTAPGPAPAAADSEPEPLAAVTPNDPEPRFDSAPDAPKP